MKQKLGMVFLLLTIGILIVAMNNGGWWWLGVTVCSALTLWLIGFRSGSNT